MAACAAFFDVDGTLTSDRVWKGLMAYFKAHGTKRLTHLAFLLVHYPQYILRRMGWLSEVRFRSAWTAHLAWYLKGYSIDNAKAVWEWIVEAYLPAYWRQDTRRLLEGHLAAGDEVMLVSSGPEPLIRRIGSALGARHVIATRLEVNEGIYTGRSLEPVCIDRTKASLVGAYLIQNDLQVDFSISFAYADSMSDLPLLELVGRPVATYPDEGLKMIAAERGWSIIPI